MSKGKKQQSVLADKNKMIRFVVIINVILLLVPVLFTGKKMGWFSQEPKITTKIQASHNAPVLRIVADRGFKPRAYENSSGEWAGADVEVAIEAANRLGMRPEIVFSDWITARDTLSEGNADIILGLEIFSNMQGVLKTIPISSDTLNVYGRVKVTDAASLANKKVGLMAKSVIMSMFELNCEYVEYYTNADILQAVADGEIDYAICHGSIAESIMNDTGMKLEECFTLMKSYPAIGVRDTLPELRASLNQVLLEMADDGTISKLENKWVTSSMTHISLGYVIRNNGIFFMGYLVILILIEAILAVAVMQSRDYRKTLEYNDTLKDALAQAKYASEAKTKFLSNMSHDIRTPMNAIVGFTAIAASHIDEKEVVKDSLGKIMTSSNHLLQLINDILDMNRIESGKMHLQIVPCNLADMMHDLVDMVQSQIQAKQLDFFVDTMNVRDEAILTDPMKFNQIFLNLIGNAIKFNKVGGFVSVRITQTEALHAGYGEYVFTVKDNGSGISPEFIDHIFEAFEREDSARTEKAEGTGLGLAIVKNIVDMLNGSIAVSSEVNKGSEFTVKLSFQLQDRQETERNMDQLKGMRALIADDDFNTCDGVSSVLRDIGMEAEWTLTGREAVLKAKQAYELRKGYSAYIIDWLMPDMNGIEVTRRIRSVIGTETPIFILTAYDWSDIEQEAKEAGVTAFCRKPLFMSDIRHVLLETTGILTDKPQEKRQAAIDEAQLKGRHILLAEDHPLNRQIVVRLLNDKGMRVDTAEDGEAAVEKFSQSAEHDYDLILMDIRMPKMDGLQATEKIRTLERRDAKEIPIVAMTANAFDEDVQKSLQAGMNAHLSKPIEPQKLYETLAGEIAARNP